MGRKVSENKGFRCHKPRGKNKNQGEIPLSHGSKKQSVSDPKWSIGSGGSRQHRSQLGKKDNKVGTVTYGDFQPSKTVKEICY